MFDRLSIIYLYVVIFTDDLNSISIRLKVIDDVYMRNVQSSFKVISDNFWPVLNVRDSHSFMIVHNSCNSDYEVVDLVNSFNKLFCDEKQTFSVLR